MEKVDTIIKCYKVPKEHIGFISAIIDSYEGMGGLRTLDEAEGYIEIWISPYYEKEMDDIINDLRKDIIIQAV
ncbi:DUF4911 domain-containing protein [Candidatus Poribacteria bacterium]|nr:DUF4911 domain-containing protein [Candidatus Poribacteria bacterium]